MGPSRLTAVYLKIISQAGVEAEMEAAGAAARSGGGVRVAATQRLVDLSGDEEKWVCWGYWGSNIKILKM